jgi:hypothetical protein
MKERKKNVDRVFFFFFSLTFFSSSFLSHFFLLLALESSFQQKEADFCKIMIDLWGLIDEVTGNSEGGKEREVLRSRSRSKRATGGKKGKKEIMWSRRKLRILFKTRQGARGDVMGRCDGTTASARERRGSSRRDRSRWKRSRFFLQARKSVTLFSKKRLRSVNLLAFDNFYEKNDDRPSTLDCHLPSGAVSMSANQSPAKSGEREREKETKEEQKREKKKRRRRRVFFSEVEEEEVEKKITFFRRSKRNNCACLLQRHSPRRSATEGR